MHGKLDRNDRKGSKAFDEVPHQRLLRKMKDIGIVGNVLNWVRSFLTGRNQRVRVENEFSNSVPVKSGIPQGSRNNVIRYIH